MPSALSIKLGDFLYKNAFPVYNILYPVFKRKQDKHEIELLHKNIRKGDIVLYIGANIGFYTQLLSDLVGENGKVYAFEPDKKNYSYLQQNTGQLKNVAFFHKAVSNKTGNLTLYHSNLLNVDHKTYATENYTSTTEIECVAMDDIIPNHKVDFIKIDIQGFEYFAFKGMQTILSANENLKIISEFYPYGLKESNVQIEDFLSIFIEQGFKIYLFENGIKTTLCIQDAAKYKNLQKDEYFNLFIEK